MATTLSTMNRTIGMMERAPTSSPDSLSVIHESDMHARQTQATLPLEDSIDGEPLDFKTDSSTSTDSGYASLTATPDKPSWPSFTEGIAISTRKLLDHKVKLSPFDQEVPQPIRDRFQDLIELFDKPLFVHLTRSKADFTAISIKLKILGITEATAKPWIVVQCDKTVSKKVKQFFNQSHIKAEYHPHCNIDPDLPSFQVLVCSRPPRLMDAITPIEVLTPYRHTGGTLCGTIVQINHPDHPRFATIGGIVKIGWSETDFRLYGMTAGHVTVQEQPDNSETVSTISSHWGEDDYENSDDEEDDENYFVAEEDFDLEVIAQASYEAAQDRPSTPPSQDRLQQHPRATLLCGGWSQLGYVSHNSLKPSTNTPDLDWALILLNPGEVYCPNYLEIPEPDSTVLAQGELKTMLHELKVHELKAHEPERSVVLMSGTRGPKEGKLSTSASYLMVKPATALTRTYNLILSQQSGLDAGDCGSWVVDRTTFEVYGHVVAIDAFGEVHIVPLNATFQDMQHKLGAFSVGFPSKNDVKECAWQSFKARNSSSGMIIRELDKYEAKTHSSSSINSGYATMNSSPDLFFDAAPIWNSINGDLGVRQDELDRIYSEGPSLYDGSIEYTKPVTLGHHVRPRHPEAEQKVQTRFTDTTVQRKYIASRWSSRTATKERDVRTYADTFRENRLSDRYYSPSPYTGARSTALPKPTRWSDMVGPIGSANMGGRSSISDEAAVDTKKSRSDAIALQAGQQTVRSPVAPIDDSATEFSLAFR